MSRSLFDLIPLAAESATRLIADAKAEGINLLVTSTFRSFNEQADLYELGRTRPGRRVTNAKPGQSFHNVRRALDVVPLDERGKPNWAAPNAVWGRIGALGMARGFFWGGHFTSFPDRPHFEWRWCQNCGGDHVKATAFDESGKCKVAA